MRDRPETKVRCHRCGETAKAAPLTACTDPDCWGTMYVGEPI